ncbi:MAG: hypothetical protein HY088_04285 [Ignavibacteriales bacterium]|nr:hypothetical protein [Ignavibacteriales bacterium]
MSAEPTTLDEEHQIVDEVSRVNDVGMKEDEVGEPNVPSGVHIEPPSEIGEHQQVTTPAFQETSQSLSESSYAEHGGEQDHPLNKSKWQTWKEKIQGFIKKLFA